MRNHTEHLERAAKQANDRGEPLVLWPEDMHQTFGKLRHELPVISYINQAGFYRTDRAWHWSETPDYQVGLAYGVCENFILEYARKN